MQFIPPSTSAIRSDKNWFRLEDGRWLMLRGISFGPSAKLPPHLPFRTKEDWNKFQTAADLLLAGGFTMLRLPFFWSAFEPICNPTHAEYNETYLHDFFYYVRLFEEKGFLILIDLHQDLLGNAFGGNGMPEWVLSEGARRLSFLNDTPLWGANYEFNRPLRKTFTEFWNNDLTNRSANPPLEHFKVRDRFLDTIERIAQEAATCERVLGIEIFNEPHPARLKDRKFEEEILPAFYAEAIRRIRNHSQTIYAFVSPQSDWNVNLRRSKLYDSFLPVATCDDRVVFAYHYYDSLLTALGGRLFSDSKREEYVAAQRIGAMRAREKGMVPFLTEFGTRQNWTQSIVRRHMDWQFEAVEQSLVNAAYWNVNLYNTPERRDGFMREDFSLIGPIGNEESGIPNSALRNWDIAVRPYPIAASAEPIHSRFSLRTKQFELVLRGKPLDLPTVIYVPTQNLHSLVPVHYPHGIQMLYNGTPFEGYSLNGNNVSLLLDAEKELHSLSILPR
ncbi:MAG TPA: cellulase family glycosylhydrolase [Candidatus Kapabacteria bacterium]